MTRTPDISAVEPDHKAETTAHPASENGAGPHTAHAEARPTEPVTLNVGDPHFRDNAYDIYADLRTKGPVTRVRVTAGEQGAAGEGAEERRTIFGPGETFFVTHYDEVVATLLDDRFSVDLRTGLPPEQRDQQRPVPEEFRPLARSILTIDPPDHTRLRKLVQPSFTGRAMEALRANIQQIADDLLDKAEQDAAARGETAPNRTMDLIAAFAYPMPVTVISDMLGIPREDRETIREWTENLLRVDRRQGQGVDEATRAGLREFASYLRDLFERKRRHPADDMITRLVQAEEDGDRFTEDEILSMVFLLFLAGHVTTVNLIGNGVVALLTHPDQLAQFKAKPELVRGVVRRRCATGARSTSSAAVSPRKMSSWVGR
jgi:cytochrome P450